jgi:hypothetical protein
MWNFLLVLEGRRFIKSVVSSKMLLAMSGRISKWYFNKSATLGVNVFL